MLRADDDDGTTLKQFPPAHQKSCGNLTLLFHSNQPFRVGISLHAFISYLHMYVNGFLVIYALKGFGSRTNFASHNSTFESYYEYE